MGGIDLTKIIGNISQSLFPIQHFISGGAYLLGLILFFLALVKLKKIGEAGGSEKKIVPLIYMLSALALIYSPSALKSLANTTFGVGNVLQYTEYNPYNIYNSLTLVMKTAGLIWFVRGCVLLTRASEPRTKWGAKGLIFLCAGVLAMNFHSTVGVLGSLMNYLQSMKLNFISHGP